MKTYQFIDSVKKLGYSVGRYWVGFNNIEITKDDERVATVYVNDMFHFFRWEYEGHEALYKLIMEFVSTPLDERKYEFPDYIEYQNGWERRGYFVGRRYHMARHGELVIAKLAFGENSSDNQPISVNNSGLRGPAAMLYTQHIPDNYGFYWIVEPTENYDERTLTFLELIQSTDNPFDENEDQPEPHSEVVEIKA